jgi:Ran GTPase-activating protein (RanGAP) involved in mRNA processing and transport
LILDLSNNELQAEDLLPLTAFIKKCPIIYQLDLRDNLLSTGHGPSQPLVALFEIVSPLSHLYLSNTAFNSASAECISPMLHKNPCLMHLDLRNNALTEAGALSLIKAVGYQHAPDQWHLNTVLTAVRLQNNKFSMSDRIGREIVILQKALDADHSKKNGDAGESYSELGPYVLQVDGINVGQMALHELVIFYQNAFSKNASAERL